MSEHPKASVGVDRYYGLYEAVVIDNANDPLKIKRVKVRFTEIAGGLKSAWAPIQSLFSGPNAGDIFIPENGAYVTVQFMAGDVNRPVVTGGIWTAPANKSTIPDAAREAEAAFKGARGQDSAAIALGGTITEPQDQRAPQYPKNKVIHTQQHLLELDDTTGAERISITHKKGTTYIDIYKDGSMVIGLGAGFYFVTGGAAAEHVKGRKDVVVDGDFTLLSQNQKIQGLNRDTEIQKEVLRALSVMWEIAGLITLKGNLATILAPIVNLGPGTTPGPVVTTITHPIDYITGIPIVGTPTVLAG